MEASIQRQAVLVRHRPEVLAGCLAPLLGLRKAMFESSGLRMAKQTTKPTRPTTSCWNTRQNQGIQHRKLEVWNIPGTFRHVVFADRPSAAGQSAEG